jgi:mono/diheme cytochrome c family protein
MHGFFKSGSFLFFAVVAGCSSTSANNGTSSDAAAPVDASPVVVGQGLVVQNGCTTCHGDNMGGGANGMKDVPHVYPPNVTTDSKTGIGDWTDAQIKAAIKSGLDDKGQSLCWVMPRFSTLTDAQLDDIVVYLKSLPKVSQDIPESECPTDGGTADDGGAADAASE